MGSGITDKRISYHTNYWDMGIGWSGHRTIAVKDSIVHIVWTRGTGWGCSADGRIYYIRSTDYGANFEPDTQLVNFKSFSPEVACWDNFVHVAWTDAGDGNSEIYKRSDDNGLTWGQDIRVTNTSKNEYPPSLAVWGNTIHLVVMRECPSCNNREIYYIRSTNNGSNWETPVKLTTNNVSFTPVGCIWENTVHVV